MSKVTNSAEVARIQMPNGEVIDAVLIKSFEETFADNDFVRDVQDLYYGQNRLFLRKYRYEIYSSEDGEDWLTNVIGEVETEILCDCVVIPKYDELLENTLTVEPEEKIAGLDYIRDTEFHKKNL